MTQQFSDTKAIIFDMDGVLFMSSDCHAEAFRTTLAEVGIADFSYSTVAGMRTDEAFRQTFKNLGRVLTDSMLLTLVQKKRDRAIELLEKSGEIAVGSAELVKYLGSKYMLVLASSASPRTVELFLRKCGYANAFQFYLSGSDIQHAKPKPDIYELAVKKLNVSPKECVVIEDSLNGVQAAVAAGVPVIALAEPEKKMEFLRGGAAMVVSNLGGIKGVL